MKLLIGCPTCRRYGYCVDIWLARVREIADFSKDIEVDYLLADNSEDGEFYESLVKKGVKIIRAPFLEGVKERIVFSRNVLREKFLEGGYDYFFSLEQDVIPEKDILTRLLSHNKKIVSAYYDKPLSITAQDKETGEIKKFTLALSLVWMQHGGGIRRANPPEVLNRGLISVGGFGVGCVLIAREVLEKIKFRFEPNTAAFDDMYFCYDAKNLGYKLFLDSDLRVEHLHKAWD